VDSEFDFGSEGLKQRMSEIAGCHWLGSNILEKDREDQPAEQAQRILKGVTDLLQVRVTLEREQEDSSEVATANGTSSAATNHNNNLTSSSSSSSSDFPRTTDATIGLFGLCTPATPQLSWPGPLVHFAPSIPVAQRCVQQLTGAAQPDAPIPVIQLPRASETTGDAAASSAPASSSGAAVAAAATAVPSDALVAVTHLHLGDDRRLARALPILSAILGGHDHEAATLMEGNTLVFKSGQNAMWLGIVDLRIEVELTFATGPDGKQHIVSERKVGCYPSWSLVSSRGVRADPAVEAMVQRSIVDMEAAQALASGDDLDEIVAQVGPPAALPEGQSTPITAEQAAHALLSRTSATRAGPSSFADMVADSMAAHYISLRGEGSDGQPLGGCDGAIINGGFIRGDKSYPLGASLTVRDIRYELPFPKVVVLLRIRGEFIVQALNAMLAAHPSPVGCYPHVSAEFRVEFDASRPPGTPDKILGVWHRGAPIDPSRVYNLAVTTFMHSGGDGIKGFTFGRKVSTDELRVSDLVLKYLRQNKIVHPNLRPRVVAVKAAAATH
jgi:2',3'-cyclic-nucleotide 2'-phosphodiesterase (5'-nucleotidase family)